MHRRHATALALALVASPASAYEPERAMAPELSWR